MFKILIATFLLFINFTAAIAQGFKLDGEAHGIKDSTWLYLSIGNRVDSTMVLKTKFRFKGKVDTKAQVAVLYTAKYTDYAFFWIENKPMSIDVTSGQFKKGIIKGSLVQDEDHKMQVSKSFITNEVDSLNKLLRTEKDRNIRISAVQRLSALRYEEQQFDINYVKNHPLSLISAHLLSIYATTWGKETTAELYKNFSSELKRTQYGIDINSFIVLNKNVKEGNKANYILLDFWASWCGPCRGENPTLVKMYSLYKDKGLAILGISLDDNKSLWIEAIKADGLTWENVSDLKGSKNNAALIYGINGIPDNFLIDKSGTIIARNLRGERLEKKLQELMP